MILRAAGSLGPVPNANTAPAQVATIGFGSPGEAWGAVWCGSTAVALLGDQPAALSSASVESEGAWTLAGEGVELRIEPQGEPAFVPDGSVQACRVCGSAARPGWPAQLDLAGVRSRRTLTDPERLQSLHHVLAWFPDGLSVALDAARPLGARGHDRDRTSAVLLEPGGPTAIEQGRLSITYRAGEQPLRVGLELWPAGEGDQAYPRRLAGEVEGAGAIAALEVRAGLQLWLGALRAHHGGQEGVGALMLARRS